MTAIPTNLRRSGRRTIITLFVLALVAALLPILVATPAGADHTSYTQASNNIQFNLEGCRSSAAVFGISGPFICPDPDIGTTNDDEYTNGNLGKSWNELDLVPHRLTTTNSGDTAETYNIVIAADYLDAGTIGYDVLSDPVVDTATPGVGTDASDASCQVSTVHGPFNDGPSGGGADQTIYRILEITQGPNSLCVFDYWIRLSLEASDYSGSSLQSYKFELVDPPTGDPTDFSVGKATISIPTKDVEPVEITKDMTATQGADNVWNLTKGATPTVYDFGCTCEDGNEDPSTEVSVTVNWSVLEVQGDVKVVTNVYANNTASRALTFDLVDDELFDGPLVVVGGGGPDPLIFDVSGNSLGTSNEGPQGPFSIPGLTNQLLATFTFDVDVASDLVGTTWSNKATATVKDPFIGDTIGAITAVSGATIIQGTATNATAVITDVESISDADGKLSYSVDSFTGATGAFEGGYVAGTPTQEDVTWVSDSQSAAGSVTFTKTVYLDGPAIVTDGSLSDVASLLASDGFATDDATAETTFTSDAKVELTINKTITGGVLADGQSETFLFDVFDGPDLVAGDVEVTITGPATSGSATVEGLEPGVEYTVSEQDKAYWTEEGDKTITIDLPNCEGSVDFQNTFAPDLDVTKSAEASYTERHDWDVAKSVDPLTQMGFPGDNLPWTWTIDVTETVVDQDFAVSGQIDVFNPMPYEVTATVSDELDDFTPVTVDCPGNSVTVAPLTTESCSYSASPDDDTATLNTATATTFGQDFTGTADVVFVKNVENDSATVSDIEIGLVDEDANNAPFTGDDSVTCSTDRAVYAALGDGFMYMDTVPNTATLTDSEGTVYEDDATTEWQCKTGFVDIVKTTNGAIRSDLDIKFGLYSGETQLEELTTLGDDDGKLEFQTALVPGDSYTICEGPVPSGFTFEVTPLPPDIYPGPPGTEFPTGEVQCFDFTALEKDTSTFTVENSFPGGGPRTPGYWMNWSTCSGGNQAQTAEKLGGTTEGVYLLDDLLPKLVGDLNVNSCEIGVLVLDARKQSNGNKKMANDAAYDLARSYLAAQLNQMAGACDPADDVTFDVAGVGDNLTFEQVLAAAQQLLDDVNYDGTASYLGPRDKSGDRAIALALHGIIDDYNNGEICNGEPSH